MPGCMVIGCLSGSGREQFKYGSSPLPKSEEIRTKWLEIINRPDYEFVNSARICHKHFHEEDFVPNTEHKGCRGQPLKRRKLKPMALPSLYLSSDSNMEVPNNFQNQNDLQMVNLH